MPYTVTLSAFGQTPFTWSVSAGTLPSGLTLNGTTGEISGTPTMVETQSFTIQVSDPQNRTDTQDYTVAIGDTTALVERVSVASDGTPGNSDSGGPALSDDGRFVAFTSFSTNLVPSDTNNVTDVFLRDRLCGLTILVSVASDGTQGNKNSFGPALSSLVGGTLFVAYTSDSSNLVPADANNTRDVFVTAVTVSGCTLTPVSTVRASVATDGTEGNSVSTLSSLSADGSEVLYNSFASNLTPVDTNGVGDVFLSDLQFAMGVLSVVRTRRVSLFKTLPAIGVPRTTADIFSDNTIGSVTLSMVPGANVDMPGHSRQATIVSGTGTGQTRRITANSSTTLTVDPPWTTVPDNTSVFRVVTLDDRPADIVSATTIGDSELAMDMNEQTDALVEILSGTGAGQTRHATGNAATTITVDPAWDPVPDATSIFRLWRQNGGTSQRGRLSADGATVAFDITTQFSGVFVHDPATGIVTQQSLAASGLPANGNSNVSALSGDGNLVLFLSGANNLIGDDLNGVTDLFVRDRSAKTTTRVSLANDGSEADRGSDVVAGMSIGGRLIAFITSATNLTNLVADDRNGVNDLYVRDRTTSQTFRKSLGMDGTNPSAESRDPAISLDGSTVAFASGATNLVPTDTNAVVDVFVACTLSSVPSYPCTAPVPAIRRRDAPEPPVILTARLPAARAGVPYAATLGAVGGESPLFWILGGGTPPPGLSLDPATGRLSGLPQKPGRYTFTVVVMDADRPARGASRRLTLVVGP